MNAAEEIYLRIQSNLCSRYSDLYPGKMMSASAIKCNGKVIAYYHKGWMGFKLGKGFPIESMGIQNYRHLSPFKNKAPMTAWFEIEYEESGHWETLCLKARAIMLGA